MCSMYRKSVQYIEEEEEEAFHVSEIVLINPGRFVIAKREAIIISICVSVSPGESLSSDSWILSNQQLFHSWLAS